jgi:hypothetical protein
MTYKDQAHKNNALRGLLGYLAAEAKQPNPDCALAYDDATVRLREILDTPVAETPAAPEPDVDTLVLDFEPDDMAVVVVTPAGVLGKNMPRALFFDETSREVVLETLDGRTRAVVLALLTDAIRQLS